MKQSIYRLTVCIVILMLQPGILRITAEPVNDPIVGDDLVVVSRGGHELPLISAVCNDRIDDVRALLDRGVNVNEADKNGWTPLHWAAIFGYDRAAKLLVARGAAVNPSDRFYGVTPLHCAAAEAQVAVAAFLLRSGAHIDARDKKGRTPLHVIVERTRFHEYARGSRFEMLKCLVGGGADVNATDSKGNLPLHYAVARGNLDLVRYLVEHRSRITVRNADGDTPLMLARKNRMEEIAAFLETAR